MIQLAGSLVLSFCSFSQIPEVASARATSGKAALPFYGTDLLARIDGRGIEVDIPPIAEGLAGGGVLHVQTNSFGRVGRSRPVDPGEFSLAADLARIERPELLEWFKPHHGGIEQGWTIAAPPDRVASHADVWIGVRFSGLWPQISEDGRSARLVDARAGHRLTYGNLRVIDAGGRVLPSRMSVEGSEFGIRVDDRDARYPIEVDPFLGTSDWSWSPSDSPALVAQAANTLVDHVACGDFNGDGYTDVLVGGTYFGYASGSPFGRVWMFRGSASGPSWPNPDWHTDGPLPQGGVSGVTGGAAFGAGITVLGDISGDGIDDFAISQPNYAVTPGTSEGAVHVYLGNASGVPALHFTFLGASPDDAISVCKYVGDVDNDGKNEIGIRHSADPAPIESVQVFRGWSSGAPAAPLWTLRDVDFAPTFLDASYSNNQLFLQTGGDVDADGFSDLLVSVLQNSNDRGNLFLFRGGASGPPGGIVPTWSPGWTVTPSPAVNAQYSGSVAGDIDGNGYADLVAGDSGGAPNYFGRMHTYLSNPSVHGATLLSVVDPTQTLGDPNPVIGNWFASRREPAGDFDGDGFADVVVGNGNYGSGSAQIHVFRGTASGLASTPSFSASSFQNSSDYGTRVGHAGDVNGDGLNDVWATARAFDGPGGAHSDEGSVIVYFGRRAPVVVSTPVEGSSSLVGVPASDFGRAIATGDVNGDGVDDLLVGAPLYSNGQSGEGRVALFLGDSLCGFRATPDWTFESGVVGAHLGASVALPGDVDGDGYSEVLVGAPDYSTGLVGRGKVFLFRGQPPCPFTPNQPCPHAPCSDLLTQSESWSFQGSEVNAHVGAAVAGAGDVNGDGFSDLLVGAPGNLVGSVNRGAVYVFLGRVFGVPTAAPSVVLDAGQQGARFGAALATAGDIDRDGLSDVVVGAPGWSNGAVLGVGRVFAYRGIPTPAGVDSTPNWFYAGVNVAGAGLGSAVASAGDVDTNGSSSAGYADIVVGAPGYPPGSGGTAYVFHGRGGVAEHLGTNPQTVLTESQVGAQNGAAVACAGDVNGDGYSDVLVGAPGFDNASGAEAGRVSLYLGSSTGLVPVAAWSVEGTTASANVGAWVTGGGDFDGDGYSDLAWGVPGTDDIYVAGGYVQRGPNHEYAQRRLDDTQAVILLGVSEDTSSLRLQGGSSNPFHLSSTPAGRGRIRLEWEVKALSDALDGSALQRQLAYSNTGPVGGVPPLLSAIVGGLDTTTAYQWRSRVQHATPILAHTRWLQLQGNGKRATKFRLGSDCNENGAPDIVDLQGTQVSQDCNGTGVPDECEVPPICPMCVDCDPLGPTGPDGVPDACQLDFGNDCDDNGVPDFCQTDCDGNSVADACDILLQPNLDTNDDGVIDSCQQMIGVFCAGDGSGTACPCGNSSQPADAEGCLSSLGTGGRLRSSGVPRWTADNFTLVGTRMPNSSALYYQGMSPLSGGLGAVFGDGKRCAAGTIVRLGTKTNSGGISQYPTLGDASISVRGVIPFVGGTRVYQCWYRNAATFCTASTFNLTNGLSAVWIP